MRVRESLAAARLLGSMLRVAGILTAREEIMQIIECQKCGAKNRVETGKSGQPVCGRCGATLTAETHPLIVTEANFGDEVQRSPLPVLLDMWAPWCGPCRIIAPVIEQLAAELAGRVRVAKLNVDENPGVAEQFGVRSIPTLLMLKEGREVDRILGAQPRQAILNFLQRHI